jgi:hypothetical protein
MVDFAKLRKGNSAERLQKALEQQNRKFVRDERYWQPTVDKAGNGFAVIRFLMGPAIDMADDIPPPDYSTLWTHAFQGPGGWYIENSLTTIGLDDPVSEINKALWDTGVKANREIASARKRKLNYISNIWVVKDAGNPANEGKHFLYSYGTKIMDKIKDKLGMETNREEGSYVDPDEVKFNAFDFWEGADFKLKIRKVGDFRNYDKSEFAAPSPIFGGDDAKIEKLWKDLYSLKAEVAPDKFKTYDELKKRLDKVLGAAGTTGAPARAAQAKVEDDVPPTEAEMDREIKDAISETPGEDGSAYAEFARLAEAE